MTRSRRVRDKARHQDADWHVFFNTTVLVSRLCLLLLVSSTLRRLFASQAPVRLFVCFCVCHVWGHITGLSGPKTQLAVREIRPKEGAATSTVVEGPPYTHTEGPHCHPLTVKVGSGGSHWGPHCQSWQWGSQWGLTVPPRVRVCPGGSAGWQ